MTSLRAHALPLALLAGLAVAVPADAPAPRATVYYVDARAAAGGDGLSWATATPDLQAALALAVSGDEVWVARGTYTPHASDRDVGFAPADGVAVYGGFPTGGSVFGARDPDTFATVLSGDLAGNDRTNASGDWTNRGENALHVLDLSGRGAATVLHGLTVTAGNADGGLSENRQGGGLLCDAACSPTLTDIAFSDNTASSNGGAVYIHDGTPTFTGATFSGNETVTLISLYGGGAVYIFDGTPTFTGATFSDNTTRGNGGAVYIRDGTPTFDGAAFSDNTAPTSGGAVYVDDGTPTFTGATFSGNEADRGGAVYVDGGEGLTFTNAAFSDNIAETNGGAVSVRGGSSTFTNAAFSGNSVNDTGFGVAGGAVYVDIGSAAFTNATFSGNRATTSGGSFAGRAEGGAVYVRSGSAAFTNTILWGNTATHGNARRQQVWREGGTVTATSALVQGGCPTGATCSDLVTGNPLFVDAAAGDYTLRASSPAVDAGDAALLPPDTADLDGDGDTTEPLPLDAAGNPRVQDGDASGSAEVDLGAFEREPLDCPAGVCHVDATATGAGTGGTWADAYSDLRRALVAAVPGDQVWVAEGTYTPVVPADPAAVTEAEREMSFAPPAGVFVYGGFPSGGGDGTFSARDPDAYETVLSGDLNGDDATAGTAENTLHVVYLDGRTTPVTAATRLDGLTITAGNADGSSIPGNAGGGLFCDARSSGTCSPTLVGLRIVGNAARNGAGLLVYAQGDGAQARPTLANVTIAENDGVFGGGAYVYGQAGGTAAPVFMNAVIDRNAATTWGGGVFVQGVGASSVAEPTFENATIAGNTANNGGGLRVQTGSGGAATATLDNAVLWGNTATGANPQIGFSNGAATLTAALVEGGCPADATCTGATLDADPQFTDAAAGVLTLRPGSPARDAGDATLRPADAADLDGDGDTAERLPLDLAGNARVRDGDGDGTAALDLGAFEGAPIDCPGGICRVDAAATGLGDGSTWADAYPSLQTALAAAEAGDAVWVAAGTYTPHASDRDASFAPRDGVALYGGFPTGGGDGTFAARDPDAYATVLSGDLDGDDVLGSDGAWANRGENARHVLDLSGRGAATVLHGLTVTAGNADGSSGTDSRGGGLHCASACSPVLAGVTFQANYAMTGGATYVPDGAPSFAGATFSGNSASVGGAAYIGRGSSSFAGATFSANSALGNGGAAYISSGSSSFDGTTFAGNTSAFSGGAIYVSLGTSSFDEALFSGNEAKHGGAAANEMGDLSFRGATFSGNMATIAGGAIYTYEGSNSSFYNTTFSGNSALISGGAAYVTSGTSSFTSAVFQDNTSVEGGAVYVDSGPHSFTNVIFKSNESTNGGAVYYGGGSSSFSNTTFWGNTATTSGGAAYISSGTPSFANAILWGNTAPGDPQMHVSFGTPTLEAVLVEGGCPAGATCTGALLTADPLFADAPNGDLSLGPGSPAVDAGDASLLPTDAADLDGDGDLSEPLPLDAAGAPRVRDGDGDGATALDLGAFEAPIQVCPGGVCYVDAAARGDGGSWADATPDLQAALALAAAGDAVWVAEGTYTPHASDRAASFAPPEGVAVYGGFPTGGSAFDARDPDAYETVLSGDLNRDDALDGSGGWTNRADNARHVLDLSTGTITAATVLDGLTIAAGHADAASGADSRGGGFSCGASCDPTLAHLTFTANHATAGGAMYVGGGAVAVRDATFSGNTATQGGALYVAAGSPSFPRSAFSDNTGAEGGAVYVATGSPSFGRATFSGNEAVTGGAVYTSGSPTFASATFAGNRAATTSGGAIGGAVYVDAGAPSFAGSAFVGNDAATGGGGAYVQGGSPSFASTTFAGNSATRGGAAQVLSGSTVSFSNAVLWGNTGTQAANRNQVFTVSGATTLTTALVQDGCPLNATCSGALLTVDPQFTDAAGGDASLARGSPAMDAGDPSLLPADAADLDGDGDTAEPLPLDAAGAARAQGLALDLGAFEVTPSYDGRLTLTAEGWRMLSTPIAGTYDDLLGDRWTQGFENSDNPDGACTAYTFDETVQGPFADGWTCLTDQMAPFARASGVMAYVYADDDPTTPDDPDSRFPKSFAFTGETSPPPFGDFALTFTPNPTETRAGWNLAGNPLGAAIDWDRVQIGAALGETAYVYDPELNGGGDYRVRRKGFGSLEDGVIPAFQGFFVQAYGPGPTLVVPDSAVVDGASPDVLGRRAAAAPAALQLDLGVVQDDGALAPASTAFVAVEAGYAVGLDRGDGRRLRPTAWPRMVLSTHPVGAAEPTPLAINVVPPGGPVDLPLEVAAEGWAPGRLELRLAVAGGLPEGWTAALVDTEAGTEAPLVPGGALDLALSVPAARARSGDLPGLGLHLGAPFGDRPPVGDSTAVAARAASGAPVSTGARYVLRLTPSATATEAEPVAFGLGRPAPNPSRGAVRLSFGLDAPGPVRLVVFDLLGREVLVLADGDRPAGSHEAALDGSALAPGVYAVRLVAGEQSAVARFTVVR